MHEFAGSDGYDPNGGLTIARNGNFYGTTSWGGTGSCGTVFEITPTGAFTTIVDFSSTLCSPMHVALYAGADGNFYGTTTAGGLAGLICPNGCGAIFRMTPSGELTTLHSFQRVEGIRPAAGLVAGEDGNFYGTTSAGGASGLGTIFKISAEGSFQVIHSFSGTDGQNPNAPLVAASDFNLYGVTATGGAQDYGTVFRVSTEGTFSLLYSFGLADGTGPTGLVQDTNGTLYGSAASGGAYGDGDVFSVSGNLPPFVNLLQYQASMGSTVEIFGQGLIGTTGVLFSLVPSNYVVHSDTYITAVVPAGAATGDVEVVTPTRRLDSTRVLVIRY